MLMSDALLQEFNDTVATQIGLRFPRERWPDLLRGMTALALEFDAGGPEQYMRKLMSKPLTRHQVEMLASQFSVGETYFFRDAALFAMLEQEVLPHLIEARRSTGKRLRIWSAGCCTGEEAYSLAILVSRLLPDLADWNITVSATDINPHFLHKAACGIYREWSFRNVPAWIKQGYFQISEPGIYSILPHIQRMVRFEHLNLVDDVYPSLGNNTSAMDIVLCRNVLMYLEPARIEQIVHKFHRTLVDGGWLAVSPAETDQTLFSAFNAVKVAGATMYRKNSNRIVQTQPDPVMFGTAAAWLPVVPEAIPPSAACKATPGEPEAGTPYQTAFAYYEQGAYEKAVALLLATDCNSAPAMGLLARLYANRGQLDEAHHWCQAAIAADKCNCGLRYLLAAILEEQGRPEDAAHSLKRALYLDHNFVLAHFALANLYRNQGKAVHAGKHYANALNLLHAHASDDILPESEGITAGRLMEIIRARERAA